MINWQYYPKRKELPTHLKDIVDIFVLNQIIFYNKFIWH